MSPERDIQAGGGGCAERQKIQHCPRQSFLSERLKVACFVDWENVRKQILTNKDGTQAAPYNSPEFVPHFVRSFLEKEERFYRIFLYTSLPVPSVKIGKESFDLTQKPVYTKAKSFIDSIGKNELFAIRLGKMRIRNPEIKNGEPVFTPIQKQVDMLMGLDIAHVSYLRLVDRILLFSYDNDLIPAIKTARINGIQVAIAECPDRSKLSGDLRLHADFVRSKTLSSVMASESPPPEP